MKCVEKKRFDTEASAHTEMVLLKFKSRKFDKLKRAYECTVCGKWHLTSQEYKPKKCGK